MANMTISGLRGRCSLRNGRNDLFKKEIMDLFENAISQYLGSFFQTCDNLPILRELTVLFSRRQR